MGITTVSVVGLRILDHLSQPRPDVPLKELVVDIWVPHLKSRVLPGGLPGGATPRNDEQTSLRITQIEHQVPVRFDQDYPYLVEL